MPKPFRHLSRFFIIFSTTFILFSQNSSAKDADHLTNTAELPKVDLVGKELILTSSCAMINAQINALRKWATTLGQNVGNMPAHLSGYTQNICKANITHSVPHFVKLNHERLTAMIGPNCVNACLLVNDHLDEIRYIDNNEWQFFLNSKLCTEVKSFQKREPGDIGNIFDAGDKETHHGFIYVTDELVFNKTSWRKTDAYLLESTNAMIKAQKINANAIVHPKSSANSGGDYSSAYFRCKNLTQYIDANQAHMSRKIKTLYLRLQQISCEVSSCAKGEQKISLERAKILLQELKQIKVMLGIDISPETLIKNAKQLTVSQFMEALVYFRALSLEQQFGAVIDFKD